MCAQPLAGRRLAQVDAEEGGEQQQVDQCHADVGGGSGVVDAVHVLPPSVE